MLLSGSISSECCGQSRLKTGTNVPLPAASCDVSSPALSFARGEPLEVLGGNGDGVF